MERQTTPEVIEQYAGNDLLDIIELEDRLEMAAIQDCCCCLRCLGDDHPVELAL